ncbi:hypothetical protein I7I51_05443 [Histoplasma capsulatum]|uniref:Uncharacterized protein n=1 Tax=Ajellomyces capsulatus TaxID=5037 RepID=A0A8A1M862_AJECA|nr:hypothetical protein I7I51_05443 [Histoplasma capsulatum]
MLLTLDPLPTLLDLTVTHREMYACIILHFVHLHTPAMQVSKIGDETKFHGLHEQEIWFGAVVLSPLLD